MKLKKIAQYDIRCMYALQEVSDIDVSKLTSWLNTHCPGEYVLDRYHLLLPTEYSLFLHLEFLAYD